MLYFYIHLDLIVAISNIKHSLDPDDNRVMTTKMMIGDTEANLMAFIISYSCNETMRACPYTVRLLCIYHCQILWGCQNVLSTSSVNFIDS